MGVRFGFSNKGVLPHSASAKLRTSSCINGCDSCCPLSEVTCVSVRVVINWGAQSIQNSKNDLVHSEFQRILPLIYKKIKTIHVWKTRRDPYSFHTFSSLEHISRLKYFTEPHPSFWIGNIDEVSKRECRPRILLARRQIDNVLISV